MSETDTFRRISGALRSCIEEHGPIDNGSVFSATKRVEGELFKKRHHVEDGEPWPGGVSDGLTSHCSRCLQRPAFDYGVDDALWERVVPKAWRRGVLCLPCLDTLATREGQDVSEHLGTVQFTGQGKTIVLRATNVYTYDSEEAP